MLVLSRKVGEVIKIGEDIEVVVTGVKGSRVRLGIGAPDGVRILRQEVAERETQQPEEPTDGE